MWERPHPQVASAPSLGCFPQPNGKNFPTCWPPLPPRSPSFLTRSCQWGVLVGSQGEVDSEVTPCIPWALPLEAPLRTGVTLIGQPPGTCSAQLLPLVPLGWLELAQIMAVCGPPTSTQRPKPSSHPLILRVSAPAQTLANILPHQGLSLVRFHEFTLYEFCNHLRITQQYCITLFYIGGMSYAS